MTNLSARVGPVEFGTLGKLIAVRCLAEFNEVMRWAAGSGSQAHAAGLSSAAA